MEISDIGSNDDTALLCHTNSHPLLPDIHNWFEPNGTEDDVPGFTTNRDGMVVRLRRITGIPAEGIYWCSILDATSQLHTVYIGLYSSGEGNIEKMYIYFF